MMPKIDGFEVCRRIKGDERSGAFQCMLTYTFGERRPNQEHHAGPRTSSPKPTDRVEVIARIRMLLKMKILNDRLNHSYEEINNMIIFGQTT